jgi:hypothetical protein
VVLGGATHVRGVRGTTRFRPSAGLPAGGLCFLVCVVCLLPLFQFVFFSNKIMFLDERKSCNNLIADLLFLRKCRA